MLLTVACSKDAAILPSIGNVPQGQNVGNSGDFFQAMFEQGKLHTLRVLDRITPNYFSRTLKGALSPEEILWFFDRRSELRDDISKLIPIWKEKIPKELCPIHPERTCACTENGTKEVYFSFEACDAGASISQMGELILHESLHHFLGADEKKVYRMAAAIYGAWASSSFAQYPHIVEEENHSFIKDYFAANGGVAWTGKEMLTWNPVLWETASYYDPAQNTWREQTVTPKLWFKKEDIQNSRFRIAEALQTVWVGNRLLTLSPMVGDSAWDAYGLVGTVFNPETGTWNFVSKTNAPELQRLTTNLSEGWEIKHLIGAGERAVVFGGNPLNDSFATGGFYDPIRDKWETIRYERKSSLEHYQTMEWASDRLVLWGKRFYVEKSGGYEQDNGGLVYEPSVKTWVPTSPINAPPGDLTNPVAISNGKEVFIYGGHRSYDALRRNVFRPAGAIFDPAKNEWTPINLVGAPKPYPGKISQRKAFLTGWDGAQFIIIGEDVRFYNPHLKQWAVSDKEIEPVPSIPKFLLWTGIEILLWDQVSLRGLIFVP